MAPERFNLPPVDTIRGGAGLSPGDEHPAVTG
jgi:hypothetical protein